MKRYLPIGWMALCLLFWLPELQAQDDSRQKGNARTLKSKTQDTPKPASQPAQTITLRGTVKEVPYGGGDAPAEPLLGATVAIIDPATDAPLFGTYAGEDGSFEITFPWTQGMKLQVSYIGMQTFSEVIVPSKTTFDIALESDDIGMETVVVTALNVRQKKADLGYSVQTISGDKLARSAEQNLIQAMAGKVSGVQITSSGGTPGASSSILIRGSASLLGNNQPLFIVDGVPMDNSTRSVGILGNFESNRLESVGQSNRMIDLNPDDIEEINVLKGPSAAALYGTRAGAGAVVITTKKGRKGTGNQLTWRSTVETSHINRMPKLNDQFAQGSDGEFDPSATLSWGPRIDGGTDLDGNPLQRYDNVDKFFRTGVNFSNTIAYTTTTDKTALRVSVGRADQSGVVRETDFFRNSFRISMDADATNWLTMILTGNYVQSGGNRAQQGSNTSGIMLGLLRTPPSFNNDAGYLNSDGSQRAYSRAYDNPYWSVNKNGYKDRVDRFVSSASFIARPLPWLEATFRAGTDVYTERTDNHFAKGSRMYDGLLINDRFFHREVYTDLFATATHRFAKDFKISLTVGNNLNERYNNQTIVQGSGLLLPNFYQIGNASDIKADETGNRIRLISFFGFAKFHYKDLLTVGLTGRHETASTFGPDNDGFFYPSVDASFVFSELAAMKDPAVSKILSFGKVRASVSTVGIEPPPYSTRNYYYSPIVSDPYLSPGSQFPFLNQVGYSLGESIGSRSLKPESVFGFEVGTDLRFFKNRIGLDVTYYYQSTTDAIFQVPVAASSGFNTLVTNSGELENRGWEIVLSLTPLDLKTKLGRFQWMMDFNFTRNRSKLVSLADGVSTLFIGGFGGSDIRAVPGQPYGQIYGTRWLRNDAGQIVVDENGNPEIDPNEGVLGNTQPKYLLGIGNEFSLGNLSLYCLIDIREGGDIYNGTRGALYHMGAHADTENRGQEFVFNGVRADGTPNTTPITYGQDWYQNEGGGFVGPAEQFVEDGSWVRLRELSLSYSFPDIKSMKWLSQVDLTLTGRNLLLFTDYTGVDPETSLTGAGGNSMGMDYFNMPNTRSFLFSVNFTFR